MGICRLRAEDRDIDECWIEPGMRAMAECGYEPDYEYDEEG